MSDRMTDAPAGAAAEGAKTSDRKATGARNTRRAAPSRRGWNDDNARFVQDCVLASRMGGGGNVVAERRPDGSMAVTIEVRQSKDSPPELVSAVRAMRLQGVAAQQQRQQAWIDTSAGTKEPAPPPTEEMARTRKRREKRQQQRRDAAELEELRKGAVAQVAAASPPTEALEPERCHLATYRTALDRISQLSRDHAVKNPGMELHWTLHRGCAR